MKTKCTFNQKVAVFMAMILMLSPFMVNVRTAYAQSVSLTETGNNTLMSSNSVMQEYDEGYNRPEFMTRQDAVRDSVEINGEMVDLTDWTGRPLTNAIPEIGIWRDILTPYIFSNNVPVAFHNRLSGYHHHLFSNTPTTQNPVQDVWFVQGLDGRLGVLVESAPNLRFAPDEPVVLQRAQEDNVVRSFIPFDRFMGMSQNIFVPGHTSLSILSILPDDLFNLLIGGEFMQELMHSLEYGFAFSDYWSARETERNQHMASGASHGLALILVDTPRSEHERARAHYDYAMASRLLDRLNADTVSSPVLNANQAEITRLQAEIVRIDTLLGLPQPDGNGGWVVLPGANPNLIPAEMIVLLDQRNRYMQTVSELQRQRTTSEAAV